MVMLEGNMAIMCHLDGGGWVLFETSGGGWPDGRGSYCCE